jgi:hypothetical protein
MENNEQPPLSVDEWKRNQQTSICKAFDDWAGGSTWDILKEETNRILDEAVCLVETNNKTAIEAVIKIQKQAFDAMEGQHKKLSNDHNQQLMIINECFQLKMTNMELRMEATKRQLAACRRAFEAAEETQFLAWAADY